MRASVAMAGSVGTAGRRVKCWRLEPPPVVIMDNLHNVHDHPRFLALLRRLHIHPVWTPTNASWLNAIEAHFGVTKQAILTGSDDQKQGPRRRRIYRDLRYRNHRVGQDDYPLTRIRSIRPIKLERHSPCCSESALALQTALVFGCPSALWMTGVLPLNRIRVTRS